MINGNLTQFLLCLLLNGILGHGDLYSNPSLLALSGEIGKEWYTRLMNIIFELGEEKLVDLS